MFYNEEDVAREECKAKIAEILTGLATIALVATFVLYVIKGPEYFGGFLWFTVVTFVFVSLAIWYENVCHKVESMKQNIREYGKRID